MRVAAVQWNEEDLERIKSADELLSILQSSMAKASQENTQIIVFPAFSGCLYQKLRYACTGFKSFVGDTRMWKEYVEQIQTISSTFNMAVCPGSYFRTENGKVYHASCIIHKGDLLLQQKQIYLARWERELGLERGTELNIVDFDGWKMAVILPTDAFYPQVSRLAASKGVDIVLSPAGFTGETSPEFQLSGMWKDVQQNLFFAVESAFNGSFGEKSFKAEAIIHGPLEMAPEGDGFIKRSRGKKKVITAELDNAERKRAIQRFNVLAQLNPQFYKEAGIFGG